MKIEGVAVILKVGRPNLKMTATRAIFIIFRKFFHRASRLIGANDLTGCLEFLLVFLKLGRPNFKMTVTCTIFIVFQKFFHRTTCLIGANSLTSFLDLWQTPVQFSFFFENSSTGWFSSTGWMSWHVVSVFWNCVEPNWSSLEQKCYVAWYLLHQSGVSVLHRSHSSGCRIAQSPRAFLYNHLK